jgi:hypothetical protein
MDIVKRVNDDMAIFDSWFGYSNPVLSLSEFDLYDKNEFDLVPKKNHLENRLKEKEQQLANVEGIRKHYDSQIETIKKEIEELKQQINEKK